MSIPLCGTDIYLSARGTKDSPVLLYNMHDDENTAAIAGRIIATEYGGQYFELMHTGERRIMFVFNEDSITIDPNRIYTDAGIWQQMAKNKSTDSLLFYEIALWRDSILSILNLESRLLVIALHNNTNKNYSLTSYLPDGEFENEAEAAYVGIIKDMDDFYFVTDRKIFDLLSGGRYHVVLQANKTMTDDGSLSVYCAQLGIRYINIEAQHTHLIRQIKMLINAFQRLVE
jgi:hypothetical protein